MEAKWKQPARSSLPIAGVPPCPPAAFRTALRNVATPSAATPPTPFELRDSAHRSRGEEKWARGLVHPLSIFCRNHR